MLPTTLKGARTHNLAGVDLQIFPGQVVAITGVSGAGKSSLALDTLYAEGQRRFVESFSPYARQFLERLERPPMDSLEPVPAGIAVDRRAPVKSSRSTVATMSDLEPYLAALFTREALPVCPEHDVLAVALDADRAAERVARDFGGERVLITYPMRVAGAEAYLEVRERLARDGYRRLWVEGNTSDIDHVKPSSVVGQDGQFEVVVDRVSVSKRDRARLSAGLETAWRRAGGRALVRLDGRALAFTQGLACPECGKALPPARAGLFSYESPLGACATCRGFGRTLGIDLARVVPDETRTLAQGAIRPWRGKSTRWERGELGKLCKRHGIAMDAPWNKLSAAQRRIVISGDGSWDSGKFPGVLGWFAWLETRTYKMHVRVLLSRYRSYDPCRDCGGKRLNTTALSYRVGGRNIADWHAMEVHDARRAAAELEPRTGQGAIAQRELESRLGYLERVGLGYLTLDRQARTLSGGEAQRVTLTAALGTSLHNALFVLDEPTVGLHPSDIEPLSTMLSELALRNNAVLVVEHDPSILRRADRIVELGPGAGAQGGRIVADGTPEAVERAGGATARALRQAIGASATARKPTGHLRVRAARQNNLKSIDVDIPLGVVCAVTGPSGSGKSTLAVDIVYRALARRLGALDVDLPGAHDRIEGSELVRQITLVDQSPLGRTSRGNAATYVKAWDQFRALFAKEPEALSRRFGPSHFSFNVAGGRCEACSGEGYETVEMQFLADVRLSCPVCRGRRFSDEVLAVTHRGFTVADILELTVERALEAFASEPALQRALGPLMRLGLGYLRLGQPLSTLSGGEAQRLKLARALSDAHAGRLYVLDEPSAGLHADEVDRVLEVFAAIVGAGGSVLVVEHDLGVIGRADWVVDLGPGGGAGGGRLEASCTPAELTRCATRTGQALAAARSAQRAKSGARAGKNGARAGKNGAAKLLQPATVAAPAALSVVRAREHNLQDISVSIPHGALTVVTGPSGSGKSTLAFDVVFSEGQRRFLETLTPYARQFLPTMPRADADSVVGVPPSIALEQRTARAGSKSTVATVTEVAHYLRLIYAKLGAAHCPDHGRPISRVHPDALFEQVRRVSGRQALLAPVVRARKGTYLDVFTAAARAGIAQAWCDGELVSTEDPPRLVRNREHTIDLMIEAPANVNELDRASFDRALRLGTGSVKLRSSAGQERLFSSQSACEACGFSIPELDPRWFSFNTRQGRCETCDGEGVVEAPQPKRRGKRKAEAPVLRRCSECGGSRLAPIPRAVRLYGLRYHELSALSVADALAAVRKWKLDGDAARIGAPVVVELSRRLGFLVDVGLDYLSLDRAARTLSGGEMQRLRLAAQLGAGLTGALYVLDEPTIGLHPRDTARLIDNLRQLVRIGSTVLVVEHDADTIRAADHLIDLGPGGGIHGGRVIAEGTPAHVLARTESPTGRALSAPPALRKPLAIATDAARLKLSGVAEHNLRSVSVEIPLGRFTAVVGVSGSGKSTLVRQVLLPAVRRELGLESDAPGRFESVSGLRTLRRAVAVDQSPIGRTPRSVPATFLGIWDHVRTLFAATPDAQVAGFGRARFSFNTSGGGRCATCEGQGSITHEMSFLPDVVAPCPTCSGLRFEPRTLEVRYLGLSIGDVLELTAEQAAETFAHHPPIASPLRTLVDLGAGYIKLGQGSHTLSGGEAQRLKLSAELTASSRHEPTLYVLDEPTTGLHLADVSKLMSVLGRLVDRGDTLVVIEHHPQVIAGADWVIELGPEGGARGGRVVAACTPSQLAKKNTATGAVLRAL